jgi:hypothetical protein
LQEAHLYFQKTVPALLAQIEANRTKVKLTILSNLKQYDDNAYSLYQANLDLDQLKEAGGIPLAITGITQQAADKTQQLQTAIDQLRTGNISKSSSTQRIIKWLYPNGQKDAKGNLIKPDNDKLKKIENWMDNDKTDPVLGSVPWEDFVEKDLPNYESDRQRALTELNIP